MKEAVVKVRDLVKSYKSLRALNGINMEVSHGEILAFLGPNGAGKTSAINILTGLTRQDSGEVYYEGKIFDPEDARQKKMIGVVPQQNNLDRDLTVEDNLKIHGKLFGIKGKLLDMSVDEALEKADLSEQKRKIAGELSGGMKRRLVIARALMHSPKIIFLDEPSTGLDPQARRKLYTIIKRLNHDLGVSVFLTTHYIEEADILSDRVTFIDKGNIVASGRAAELKGEVGRYAVEYTQDDVYKPDYFDNREEAVKAAAAGHKGDVKIREVTLEDVYLKLTGKKMGEKYV